MLKKLFSLIGGMFLWVYDTIKMRSSGEMVYRVVSGDSGLPLPKFRTACAGANIGDKEIPLSARKPGRVFP